MNILFPPFVEHMRRYALIPPDTTVILGFSGGKDSTTLFHLLREYGKIWPFRLVLAYFNHHLRTDAAGEEAWIRAFAARHNAELAAGGKNVLEFSRGEKLNLEHAASLSRYRFFREISARYPSSLIATAHTRTDLTETFMIKLLRGSGLQGLGAIHHKKDNDIIRPLLLFKQEEILDFIRRNRLEYYHDYTNDGDDFLRNRIRRSLTPVLETLDPAVHEHIFRTVSIIQEEYDYFSELSAALLDQGLILGKALPAALFSTRHPALQRHIIREYVRRIKGDLLNIDFRHIEAVRLGWGSSRGLSAPGVELKFHKGYIFPAGFSAPGYSATLEGPGSLEIPETGLRLVCVETGRFVKPSDHFSVITPASGVRFPVIARAPRRGDKYNKINCGARQSVFEMIRASGTPAELRNLRPVLENGDGRIIQVCGSPAADAFKVAPGDGKTNNPPNLVFRWEPLNPR